jgi:hypothetical protein
VKGTEGNGDCLGTVSVPQFANFSCDLVERLIPSDLLPFVFAATADTLQRPMDATGAVVQFGRLCALNADETWLDGCSLSPTILAMRSSLT